VNPLRDPGSRPCARRWILILALLPALSAFAQSTFDDEPLLPGSIAEEDIELRARFVSQWREADGTLVLVLNGGFRLDMGGRYFSAVDAVVWIRSGRAELDNRKFYDLMLYLSEQAEVQEVGGSITEDAALLVTGVRTFGRITKYQDAHSPEPARDSVLYQRAAAERARYEALVAAEAEPGAPPGPEVTRPEDIEAQRKLRPQPLVRYSFENVEPAQTADGESVYVATGGVYFSRAGGPDSPVLEINAENAVVFPAEGAAEGPLGSAAAALGGERPAAETQPTGVSAAPAEPTPGDEGLRGVTRSIAQTLRGVYLEGDVLLVLGERTIRADRVYYDFERDRALLLDAVFRTELPDRPVPLYIRAAEMRQLSAREFSASNAKVTTSEFHTPHYHVGARRVYLRDMTARDAAGNRASTIAGRYEMENVTLNVDDRPVLWWPAARGDFQTTETLIKRFRLGYSSDFGGEIETTWELFNLLGVERPPGYSADLRLDAFTKRGPAAGIDVDYRQDDHFGLLRTYYIHDDGEDDLGPIRDNVPDTTERGRALWRHRHFLSNDWELTLEAAYVSDPSFLEEYERSEWFEGKQQETVLYLKRARETQALTFLANWRLLDFVTQTEHLPEIAYRRIGDTWFSPVVLYHESRVGGVRYRPDDRRLIDEPRFRNDGRTDVTFRADAREEAELPIKLPGMNLVPFVTGRGSYWDGQPLEDGGLWRGLGVYGVRGSGWLARVYDDVESELLDIHRVRHIIQPHFAAWWSRGTADSSRITPFDEGIETINDFYGFLGGVRQTWETKRGVGENRRTVDFLTLNLEAGFFGGPVQEDERTNGYVNAIRPEDSRTRNYVGAELLYRISDTTSLLYDSNYDLNDGRFDRHNISFTVERSPRLAYVIGYRQANDVDLDLVGGGWNYRLNEKHITAVRAWYDLDRGRIGEVSVSYVRRLPRWYVAFNVEFDEVFDDLSFSMSIWPEGVPEWTLGPRRFRNLTESTSIRP